MDTTRCEWLAQETNQGEEQMKAPPPSKDLCLLMAKITYPRDEKLSWTWLFAWGFHDAYVEGWYEGVKL